MMKIGDWVHTVHNDNKITGFIKAIRGENAEIIVTIPANYGVISDELSNLIIGETTIWLDDIPNLIGLSLQIGDNDWLEKWIEELNKWKSPHDIKWM